MLVVVVAVTDGVIPVPVVTLGVILVPVVIPVTCETVVKDGLVVLDDELVLVEEGSVLVKVDPVLEDIKCSVNARL